MEKFKGVPTLSGKVSFSATLHTVFGRQYRVIKIQNNKPRVVGNGRREGRRQDLSDRRRLRLESERRPGETLRASSVSRSFEGVQALRDVTLDARPRRGRRADRPERRRQVDARERAQRLRPPDDRHGRARRAGRHALVAAPARAEGARADVSAQPRVPRPVGARERRGVGARRRRRSRARRRGAPTRCSSGSGSTATRTRPRRRSPTATSGGSASPARSRPSRRSCCSTSRRQACPRPRCRTSPRSCARSRREHGAGVLLIDHNMALIMETCERIQVLDQGTRARRRHARPRSARTSTSPPRTSARPRCRNDAHRRQASTCATAACTRCAACRSRSRPARSSG